MIVSLTWRKLLLRRRVLHVYLSDDVLAIPLRSWLLRLNAFHSFRGRKFLHLRGICWTFRNLSLGQNFYIAE